MESAAPGRKLLPHIDLLKCLAMYFVLVFHGTLYDTTVYPNMSTAHVLRFFFRTILSTCVPLFFFVNGYLLLRHPMDLRRHAGKTLRLMLLTCFWMVFLLLVLQPYYGEFFSWEELMGSCWELKIGWNNQLWYLCTLVCVYFFFPLLKRTLDADKASFYWFTGIICVMLFGNLTTNLVMTVVNLLRDNTFALYNNNNPIFCLFTPFGYELGLGLSYFCLGGVVWTLEERIGRIPAKWRNGIAVVGLLVSCGVWGALGWRFSLYLKYTWDVVWNGYGTVFTLCNVLCLYLLSLNYRGDGKLLRLISANTLGIYLIHDLLHKMIAPVVVRYAMMGTLPGTLIYAAGLLLISLGVCLVWKKIPLIRHLI